jgi:hypothetical protein
MQLIGGRVAALEQRLADEQKEVDVKRASFYNDRGQEPSTPCSTPGSDTEPRSVGLLQTPKLATNEATVPFPGTYISNLMRADL